MSKLIEHFKAVRLDERRALIPTLKFFESIEEDVDGLEKIVYNYNYRYRFEAAFRYNAYATNVEEVEYQKHKAAEMMVHEVFGEFKVPLIEAVMECRSRGAIEAADKIQQVLDRMFEV